MPTEIIKISDIEKQYVEISRKHLAMRSADNPEFVQKFLKTFSDFIFSQSDEMLEKIQKTRPNSLLNAIFRATELGASFAKKEISFIPYEITKKVVENGVEKSKKTGEYDAVLIPDINFQKQLILKMPNCKQFFTAEVHEGVEIISDLFSGNFVFSGKNDITKPTIGYYARFLTIDGEVYDLFMTCAEIVERAQFSPQYKEANYRNTRNNIHYEKIVVRNLMKLIPKISDEIISVIGMESFVEDVEHEEVSDRQPKNLLEEAKKELAASNQEQAPEPKQEKPKKTAEKQEKQDPTQEVQPASDKQKEISKFF